MEEHIKMPTQGSPCLPSRRRGRHGTRGLAFLCVPPLRSSFFISYRNCIKKFFIKNKYVVLTHSFIQIHLRFKSSRIEIFIVMLSDLNDISNLIKNLLLFY